MPAAAKKKPAADPAEDLRLHFERQATAAVAKWRQWAEQLAAGEASPSPEDVLHVATALNLRDPGVALAADVEILKAIEENEARAVASLEAMATRLDKFGGREAAIATVKDLKARLKEVEAALAHGSAQSAAGFRADNLARRKASPRLFADSYLGER